MHRIKYILIFLSLLVLAFLMTTRMMRSIEPTEVRAIVPAPDARNSRSPQSPRLPAQVYQTKRNLTALTYTEISQSAPPQGVFQQWFLKPSRQSENVMTDLSALPLQFATSCEGFPVMRKRKTFKALFDVKYSSQVMNRFPVDANVTQLSQFWSQNNLYYQLSLFAVDETLTTYRVDQYVSSSPDLMSDTAPVPLEIDAAQLKKVDAFALVQKVFQKAVDGGSDEGARMMEVVILQGEREDAATVSYLNGLPLGFLDREYACRASDTLVSMVCACNPFYQSR